MNLVYFYFKPDLAYGTDPQIGLSTQLREWEHQLWCSGVGGYREKELFRLGLLLNKSMMECHPCFYDL